MNRYLILFCFLLGKTYAQNIDKTTTGGFGMQIGSGILHGGIGILNEYQKAFKENRRLTGIVGIGIQKGGNDQNKADYYWLGYQLGIQMEFGTSRRFITGPQIMSSYNFTNKPKDAPINKKMLWGPSYILGYKGVSDFGIMWQLTMGIVYLQKPYEGSSAFKIEPHIGIGIGYKF